jgi:hypothetical protein
MSKPDLSADLDFNDVTSAPVTMKEPDVKPEVKPKTGYSLITLEDGERVIKDLTDCNGEQFRIWCQTIGFNIPLDRIQTHEDRIQMLTHILKFFKDKWEVTHLKDMYL